MYPEKEVDAKAAGAEFVGLDIYPFRKIEGVMTDVDVIIAMPTVNGKSLVRSVVFLDQED